MDWLGEKDFQLALDEVNSKLGNYEWMWQILKMRARKHGGMFPERAYKILRRFGNPKRPYFIGTNSDGIKFVGDYRDLYSVLLIVDPHFSESFINFVAEQIKRRNNGGFIDVGANMGLIAAGVASRVPLYQVAAFEPMPSTAKRAAATFALNKLSNVRLFQMAVSDKDEEIEFFHNPGHSDRASVHKEGTGDNVGLTSIRVRSRRLDNIRNEIGKPALIKFDVEGHEPAAIAGCEQLIADFEPDIIFEYVRDLASNIGWTVESVANAINKSGTYKVYTLMEKEELGEFLPKQVTSSMVNIFCRRSVD